VLGLYLVLPVVGWLDGAQGLKSLLATCGLGGWRRSRSRDTVPDAADVDALAARFVEAGGRITKEPVDAEFFEGRSAYVADPESNYFEIASAGPDNAIVAASRRAAGLVT
jgi:hypothetical protein